MALGTYNTDGTKQTPKEYYAGTEKGNYQFISITDIINNFIVLTLKAYGIFGPITWKNKIV